MPQSAGQQTIVATRQLPEGHHVLSSSMGDSFDSLFDDVLRFADRHIRAFAIVVALIAIPLSLLFLTPVALEAAVPPMDRMPGMGGQPATFTFLDADGRVIGRRGPVAGETLPLGGNAGLSAGCLHGDGRPALLSPSRGGLHRSDPRGLCGLARRSCGGGRLIHQSADRQAGVRPAPANLQPQVAGAGQHRRAGKEFQQAADPGALSQPHLSGQRRLWCGHRGAHLFRRLGPQCQPGAGGDAGRADPRAFGLLAPPRSGGGATARGAGAGGHGGDGRHPARSGCGGERPSGHGDRPPDGYAQLFPGCRHGRSAAARGRFRAGRVDRPHHPPLGPSGVRRSDRHQMRWRIWAAN